MIRRARTEDVPRIAEIYNHYVLNSVETFEVEAVSCREMERRMGEVLATGPYIVYADGDGRVLGYAYAHPWKERRAFHITFETTVYVDHTCRHRGIGMQLMEELISQCRPLPIHALIACITGGNEASTALHRRLGFRQVSLFREVGFKFGRLLDIVDYELIISHSSRCDSCLA